MSHPLNHNCMSCPNCNYGPTEWLRATIYWICCRGMAILVVEAQLLRCELVPTHAVLKTCPRLTMCSSETNAQ